MTSLDELYDTYLRPMNLEWQLDKASRRRIILASALPAIVIIAQVVQAVMNYSFSAADLVGEISSEPWHRIYLAASYLRLVSAAAVAVLFLLGLGRWSRAEESWMFLVGALLAIVAIFLGFLAVILLTAFDDQQVILDLRVRFVFPAVSQTFGCISIGFIFLAYRGLSESRA